VTVSTGVKRTNRATSGAAARCIFTADERRIVPRWQAVVGTGSAYEVISFQVSPSITPRRQLGPPIGGRREFLPPRTREGWESRGTGVGDLGLVSSTHFKVLTVAHGAMRVVESSLAARQRHRRRLCGGSRSRSRLTNVQGRRPARRVAVGCEPSPRASRDVDSDSVRRSFPLTGRTRGGR